MTGLASQLDSLSRSIKGCRLVAYGDLQSELVLLSSGAERRPREYLDELSAEAVRLFHAFDAAELPVSAKALSRTGLTMLKPTEVRLYMRGLEADFLCLVSDSTAHSIAATELTSQFLANLARGEHD